MDTLSCNRGSGLYQERFYSMGGFGGHCRAFEASKSYGFDSECVL